MTQREKLIELLIEADMQLKYPCEEECELCDLHDVGRCDMVHMADHLIENGVVVLPCRCGECEHYYGGSEYGVCHHWQYYCDAPEVDANDFCSYGKRKGGDE